MDGIDYLIREYEATSRSLTWAPPSPLPFFFLCFSFLKNIYLLLMEIPARFESLEVE